MAGAVALTGLFLTGRIKSASTNAFADFTNCGQGLRVRGDVKLRGVLVGSIESIERRDNGDCRVELALIPEDTGQIPADTGAQIRAKTVFGEKWVELIYSEDPDDEPIAAGDIIPASRTIDPLEVETILNTALPLLDAIDPEYLSGALTALSEGFVGHEDAAIRGINSGIDALRPLNENEALLKEAIDQLAGSAEVFEEIDDDLLAAFANLDQVNRFTVSNADLIDQNLEKAPLLLREMSELFETRILDLTKLVDKGATVIGVLAARTDDLERLLTELPKFNSNWIRNLNHVCRYRQATDEPGKSVGDEVPGRCWRVHNIVSESKGAYRKPQGARSTVSDEDYASFELPDLNDVARLLYLPAVEGPR